MGVGGSFWDLLKPYALHEGIDFLRDKKVAVDLSFWIVQHQTATRNSGRAKNPHIRITFFRTVNLFSKMGAYPVFVVDGEASPLKSRARIERFCRANGIDQTRFAAGSLTPYHEGGGYVQRNSVFRKCVDQCLELLEYLGMPVLTAKGEAEALCAQLNNEGHVDACITADSDALLFGAKCLIKTLESNSKEPFECFKLSDIEAGLGLKRKQLIAISLLVGNDHDLHGVTGIGLDTAVRFVRLFNEDEVLNRLGDFGNKTFLAIYTPEHLVLKRLSHCSNCGHPGTRKTHIRESCDCCITYSKENCIAKPAGFKCGCLACDQNRRNKELMKHESWQMKVWEKISKQKNFPNTEIIDMYLNNRNGTYSENDAPILSWGKPQIDALTDFLAFYQNWEPSYTRQRILPVLSTILLREIASDPREAILLFGQYEFHSVHRVKIRNKWPFYVVKWKRIIHTAISSDNVSCEKSDPLQAKACETCEPTALLDVESDGPDILLDEGSSFLLTDENMGLVKAAFPNEVKRFLYEKELKESNSKRGKSNYGDKLVESLKSTSVQLSITQFYRSTKSLAPGSLNQDPLTSSEKQNSGKTAKTLIDFVDGYSKTKRVKRRLLFD